MAEKTTSQFLRIATSQKADDRFLSVQHIFPEDEAERHKGELFAVIEITRPWYPISQIGARIISTFRKAYYLSNSSSNIVNFEQAIKKVNEMLASLTEQGETDWIGKTNAVLGATVENDIHISSTGQTKAYLIREGKLSLITEPDKDNKIHPANTFSTITSGNLAQNDFIVIGNPLFFDTLDLPTIRSLNYQESAYQAGLQCVKLLKKQKVISASALLIKKSPPSDDPEVIYTDKSIPSGFSVNKTVTGSILPIIKKIVTISQRSIAKGYQTGMEKIYPKLKSSTQIVSQKTKQSLQDGWNKAHPYLQKQSRLISEKIDASITGIKNNKEKSSNLENSITKDPADSIIGKTIYTIHDYRLAQNSQKNNIFSQTIFSIKKGFSKLRIFFINLSKKLLTKKKRPQMLALGALLLIVILIVSISLQKNKQINQRVTKEQTKTLEEARKKVEDGKNSLVFGDKKEAQILLGNAIKEAESLKNTALSGEADQVIVSAQNEFDNLTATKRYQNITPLVNIPDAKFINIINGQAITVSQDGEIFESGITPGSIPEKKTALNKNVIDIVSKSDNLVLIYTDDQKIFRYNPGNDSVEELNVANGERFAKGKAIGNFIDNIYILDAEGNQIWRYAGQDLAYSTAEKFIPRSQIELSKVNDIGIDGSIYTLDANGKVLKLTRGEKENFDLSSIPLPFDKMDNPVQIYTEADASSIFILDSNNKRLIEFDKNGQYSHQYVIPIESTKIADIVILQKSRVAYLLADSNIYQLDL